MNEETWRRRVIELLEQILHEVKEPEQRAWRTVRPRQVGGLSGWTEETPA